MRKIKVYFAHPMPTYHTNLEKLIIASFSKRFNILNPADEKVQTKFEKYRKTQTDNDMPFFIKECKKCRGCLFITYPDDIQADGVPNVTNRVGSGVAQEVESFWNRRKGAIYFVRQILFNDAGGFETPDVYSWDGFTVLTRDQTRALNKAMEAQKKS